MAKLGSYTTIDCPTKNIDQALEYLKLEFDKIDANVRKVANDHDMGYYPSFEIDYPSKFDDLEYETDDGDNPEAINDLFAERDTWHDKANAIESAYGVKFAEWL
jgi:hypothetical protein